MAEVRGGRAAQIRCAVVVITRAASRINCVTGAGMGAAPAAVERAIALSHERYCSACIMLGKTAEISTSHEILAV